MSSLERFLREQKKTGPIKLYHGAHTKQDSLKLPETFNKARSADGHAIYLTNSQKEAKSYGNHLHHVDFHTTHDRLIRLDHPISKQSSHVKKVIHKLTGGKVEKERWEKHPTGLCFVNHVTKHITHDPIKTTELLHSHGIHGGVGESYSPKSKTSDSKVYSVYNTKHLKVTHHTYHGEEPTKTAPKPEPKVEPPKTEPVKSVQKPSLLQKIRSYIRRKK